MFCTSCRRLETRYVTHIICKKKPKVQSYYERFSNIVRPSTHQDEDPMDIVQLVKFMGYMVLPLVGLLYWKGSFAKYPDQWEQDLVPMVKKEREPPAQTSMVSYFDVIDELEGKREEALVKRAKQ